MAGVAVAGGQGLLRYVNVTVIRIITAIVLLGLGGCAAWIAAG